MNKFAIIIYYLEGILNNKNKVFVAKITREVYIVDNFKVDIFIKANILTLKNIVIDFLK